MKLFSSKYRILHITLLVILLLAGFKAVQIFLAIQASAGKGAPPSTVNTTIVKEANWPNSVKAVGTLVAKQGSILSFEDSGRVSKINFEPGEDVQAGQVLMNLDIEVEQAELRAAKARLNLAQLTASRQQSLRKQNANSQADLDAAVADLDLAKAELSRIQSIIQRRQIVAPFDGKVGVKKVNVGEYVSAGTEAVDVNNSQEFYLDFNLPQQDVSNYQLGDKLEVRVKGLTDQLFTGKLTGINSQIDPVSRNVLLQATISNRDDILKSGMFVEINLINSQEKQVLIVPATSVLHAPYGDTVYELIKETPEPPFAAKAHTVHLGRMKGDYVEIKSGLKKGQEIIASGVTKIFPGVQVFVNNEVQPTRSENPKVINQ